jgi:cytochrome c-type biogenesis protein CcmF
MMLYSASGVMSGALCATANGPVGYASLIFALVTTVVIIAIAISYLLVRKAILIRFVQVGVGLMAGCLCVASGALLRALLTDDFSLACVVGHSEKSLGLLYKIAAFWAGQEGSLLLWAWVLGIMSVMMVWRLRKAADAATAVTLTVMAVATGFFVAVMLGVANPFEPAKGTVTDGVGLNPALQNLAMVFHPPMLFLGYAGYTAPLAFMLGGLLTAGRFGRDPDPAPQQGDRENTRKRKKDGGEVLNYATSSMMVPTEAPWLTLARPWMVYSWIMMTVGIVLGAAWAYVALGWGGYWAWDPVENASLLPWLTGTALLHSAIMQVKRRTFKRWVAWLTAASFLLCILGTYLTRSGVIQSVHAFEESPIGWYFLGFMGATILVSGIAILLRHEELGTERPLEALVSREGFFLLGNALLVIITVTTVVGTMFPLISQLFATTPVTAKESFYNSVILPMALLLAALMATGPVLGSGSHAWDNARTKLAGMTIAGFVVAVIVGVVDYGSIAAYLSAWGTVVEHLLSVLWAMIHFDFRPVPWTNQVNIIWLWMQPAVFVVTAVVVGVIFDVYGTAARGSFWGSLVVRRRHWGTQLAHLGLAAIVAGVAGSSLYSTSKTIALRPGADASSIKDRTVAGYVLTLTDLKQEKRSNHTAVVATVQVTAPNGRSFTLTPEKRFYDKDPERPSTEVALRPRLLSDVYMTIAGWDDGGAKVTITMMVNPLVDWIWIGGVLMVLGGVVCMSAGRRRDVGNDEG